MKPESSTTRYERPSSMPGDTRSCGSRMRRCLRIRTHASSASVLSVATGLRTGIVPAELEAASLTCAAGAKRQPSPARRGRRRRKVRAAPAARHSPLRHPATHGWHGEGGAVTCWVAGVSPRYAVEDLEDGDVVAVDLPR